jgi:hypothetical protein
MTFGQRKRLLRRLLPRVYSFGKQFVGTLSGGRLSLFFSNLLKPLAVVKVVPSQASPSARRVSPVHSLVVTSLLARTSETGARITLL